MIIELDQTGSTDQLRRCLESMTSNDRVRSILVLACDANGFSPEEVDPILTATSVPIFGGIFPEIIHGQSKLDRGTVVIGFEAPMRVETIPGLSDPDADFEALIDERLAEHPVTRTMFVFVDGFGTRIGAVIDALFDIFGLELNYIGGGAGSLSFVQKPCLFTNQGLVQDSAVLALADIPSGIGVNHGWTAVSGPYQVTGSHGNTIDTLDWKPAAEVYREVVQEQTGKTLTQEAFFELAKGFPFGISKLDAERIVRDPIAMGDDGSLVCVGEVPQGSFVHILGGDAEALVSAARRAFEAARDSCGPECEAEHTLFIDCISRVLFLGDDFGREIEAVHRPGKTLVGALTLGEIANSGKDYLEFYNKTSVVGVFG